MKENKEKAFFIKLIPMIELQGGNYLPTVLFYESKSRFHFGAEALAACDGYGKEALNVDFKMDLGNEDPAFGKRKRRFRTAEGGDKSASEMTGDFLDGVLKCIQDWLQQNNIGEQAGIVVAEPVTMQGEEVGENWLTYYRDAIRRILLGKGFNKEQIEFLPEPFAVFHYYKYGLRHPLLGQSKQYVLVIDFGGGSFDSCIIESDKEGEITTKRKNTRPYAAYSDAVGGFFVNQVIAEQMFYKYSKGDRVKNTNIRRGTDIYHKWRKGLQDISTARLDFQHFARNFHNAIYEVEDAKIAICNSISSWELDAQLEGTSANVRFPKDPFAATNEYFYATVTAVELREWFIKYVWEQRLRNVIKLTLERGKDKLLGSSINLVLLSGGSCNIRWIEKLVEKSFPEELDRATILQLDEDFLEVVAKGLSIECARRFYSDDKKGDFTSVTYNGLNLVFDPDERGLQLKTFTPVNGNPITNVGKPCMLIPAASVLSGNFNKPLLWKVKLDRPPRQIMNYYFLRTGMSPFSDEELGGTGQRKFSDHLLNLESQTTPTPSDTNFDSHTFIELKIEKERKSAFAKFIYSHDNKGRPRTVVDAKPFYIDITDTQDYPITKAFIGLDFGTSNTSVSFISQRAIKSYESKSGEKGWMELNELTRKLPYPLAASLAHYLSQHGKDLIAMRGLEFVEASLAIAAYASYLELCTTKKQHKNKEGQIECIPSTKYFRAFTQRSLGPLWGLLRETQKAIKGKAVTTGQFQDFLSEAYYNEIDQAITDLGEIKHQKKNPDSVNIQRIIQIVANINRKVFEKYAFGFFENVLAEKFKPGQYSGRFRLAQGDSATFIESEEYSGAYPFPSGLAYLVSFEERIALPLLPLIFWHPCKSHPHNDHCYIYDIAGKGEAPEYFSYKAANYECKLEFGGDNAELKEIFSLLNQFRTRDPLVEFIHF